MLWMDDDQDPETKTEEPSGKRLEDAAEKGQIPKSKEVNEWGTILAGMIVLVVVMPYTSKKITLKLVPFLARPDTFIITGPELHSLFTYLFFKVGIYMVLPLSLFMCIGLTIGLLQSWKGISLESLIPKLNRISIQAGIKRIFSFNAIFELLKGILKIALVGSIIYYVFSNEKDHIPLWMWFDASEFTRTLTRLIFKLFMTVLVILTAIAGGDYFYQRFKFLKDMRMTKQEVKDEHKQSEGDPKIKGKLQSLRRQRSQKRMYEAVQRATAVITNPTHFAVAIAWDETNMNAPMVVAKGQDFTALRIRELAQKHGVPIVENPPLARALFQTVPLDREIPPDQYQAVADIIRFVMKLKAQRF